MSETAIQPLPTACWPVEWPDNSPITDLTVRERAGALAVGILRHLTGYQIGGCPVTVTPRRVYTAGIGVHFVTTPGGMSHFFPRLHDGVWINGGPCSGHCPSADRVSLGGTVWAVEQVVISGVTLASSAYRVEGSDLVRTDGGSWPLCSGDWHVVYLPAAPVDGLASYLAGVLAGEFAKALTGGKCRLPAGTTSVARAGLSYEIAAGSLAGGLTGLSEVDAWVQTMNPNRLLGPVIVSSPDYRPSRRATWRTA